MSHGVGPWDGDWPDDARLDPELLAQGAGEAEHPRAVLAAILLAQARRHIDQALAGGLFQRVFVSEAAPVQAHAEIVRQMLHQLHMKP